MFLNHVGRLSTNDPLLDVNQRFLEIVTLPSGTFLYAATGQDGGLSAYRLNPDSGVPRLVDRAYFPDWMGNTGGDMLRHVTLGGIDQLVIGGARHQAEGPLLGYRIESSDVIGDIVTTGMLTAQSWAIADVAVQDAEGRGALYVTDSGSGRLVTYQPQSDGTYAARGAQPPDPVGMAARIETVTLGDEHFIIATNSLENAVQSFRVGGNGTLRLVDTADASKGLPVSIPTDMEIFQAFGNTWVVLAAAGSSSLSVLRLADSGNLIPVDHVIDTLNTRFGDAQTLAVAQSASRVFIVAGGGDDGLALFTLLPTGHLLHLHSLAHETGTGLKNVEDVAMTLLGNHLQIYVTSGAGTGISRFTLPVATLAPVLTDTGRGDATLTGTAGADLIQLGRDGVDVAQGGAGDDIIMAGGGGARLTGGAGADRFVILEDTAPQEIRILDFTSGQDQLDLSDFGMLRSIQQLAFTSTATGAEIRFRDTLLLLTSSTSTRLTEEDVFGPMVHAGFSWADRVPLLRADPPLPAPDPPPITPRPDPAPAPVPPLPRSDPAPPSSPKPDPTPVSPPRPDPTPAPAPPPPGILRRGGDGDDTLIGGVGNDTLSGGRGNDRLSGLAGADEIWANEGDDTVLGGSGNDTIGGAAGDDRIYGEGGDDQIWGAAGNDRLWGGDGNDTVGGGDDNDTLYGNAGNDLVWGGHGDDVQYGGSGNDTVGGFSGDDRLWGEDGDDEVWGNVGDDTGWGGDGDDTMGGFDGDDLLYGENGNDVIGGGNGDDTLYGGSGDDTIRGRNGDDLISGDNGHDRLNGGNGADTLWGGAGEDELAGADGDDLLRGGWGNDTLIGGGGHDALFGDRDNDTLIGGWGRDTLDGGEGNDLLIGGIGADVFVFSGQHGSDRIQDFEVGTDHIEIRTTGVTRFGQLDMSQAGDDVVLRLTNGNVVIENISLGALGSGDFLFG